MKILIYDIETSPNLAYVWGKYQQDVIAYKEEWEILCFSYKWLGEREVHSVSKEGQGSDKRVCKALWKLFDEADVVIAHNGDSFDQKKAQARFMFWDLVPPSPYKSIDTRKVARKYFKFNSNKLDDLGQHLGLGRKVKTGGFELWLGCMSNDPVSWDKMRRYNERDVRLLEKVYLRMRPWIDGHPNVAISKGRPNGCPKCGHDKLKSYGVRKTATRQYTRYRCLKCGGFCHGKESSPIEVGRRN